jgi:hypothetical protein
MAARLQCSLVTECEARAGTRAIGVPREMAVAAYGSRSGHLLRSVVVATGMGSCGHHALRMRSSQSERTEMAVLRDRVSRVVEFQALPPLADLRAEGINGAAKGGRWR